MLRYVIGSLFPSYEGCAISGLQVYKGSHTHTNYISIKIYKKCLLGKYMGSYQQNISLGKYMGSYQQNISKIVYKLTISWSFQFQPYAVP